MGWRNIGARARSEGQPGQRQSLMPEGDAAFEQCKSRLARSIGLGDFRMRLHARHDGAFQGSDESPTHCVVSDMKTTLPRNRTVHYALAIQ